MEIVADAPPRRKPRRGEERVMLRCRRVYFGTALRRDVTVVFAPSCVTMEWRSDTSGLYIETRLAPSHMTSFDMYHGPARGAGDDGEANPINLADDDEMAPDAIREFFAIGLRQKPPHLGSVEGFEPSDDAGPRKYVVVVLDGEAIATFKREAVPAVVWGGHVGWPAAPVLGTAAAARPFLEGVPIADALAAADAAEDAAALRRTPSRASRRGRAARSVVDVEAEDPDAALPAFDKDRRVADAYKSLGEDWRLEYNKIPDHCKAFRNRLQLVPKPLTLNVESPPPPIASEAFRAACTVGDLFSYFPLGIKLRIGSLISKELVRHVRGRPVDVTTLAEIYKAYDGLKFSCEPRRFDAEEIHALARNQAWRVSGICLWQGETRIIRQYLEMIPTRLHGLPLADIINLDVAGYHNRPGDDGMYYHDEEHDDGFTLDGLSACPLLQRLVLSRRYFVRDITSIGSLTNLVELNLFECIRVTNLAPLVNCPKLATLDLGMCFELQDAALQPLASITSLRTLRLNFCRAITRLPNLESLTSLELEHCDGIQDLAACGLPGQITTLSLCWRDWDDGRWTGPRRGVNLTDLAPLARLEGLTSLDLSQAMHVGSLEPLALLPRLLKLNLDDTCPGGYRDTRIIDLEPLGQIATLVKLDLRFMCKNAGPDALSFVRNLTALEELIIVGCGANAEGDRGHDWNFHHLSGHPTLRRLNINNHELTDAKIAFLPSLPELRSLHINLPKTLTTLEATLMRCPKLRKLNYDLYHFDPYA